MSYANPEIPEEINYSKANPLKEFALLVFGVFVVLFVLVVAVNTLVQTFAHHIPFRFESKFTPVVEAMVNDTNPIEIEIATRKQAYLQTLTAQLAQHMNLPEEMVLHVHYIEDETVNAAATLNGNILVFKGLLDAVESENELAFVLSHEIAHIKLRHPITSLSSGVLVGLVVTMFTGSIESGGTSTALNSSVNLGSLSFSRKQEKNADIEALAAVHAHYGHIGGSLDFFKRLKASETLPKFTQFVSTHPHSEQRIDSLEKHAAQQGYHQSSEQNLIALPTF